MRLAGAEGLKVQQSRLSIIAEILRKVSLHRLRNEPNLKILIERAANGRLQFTRPALTLAGVLSTLASSHEGNQRATGQSRILEFVFPCERGEEILITKRNKPVLSPYVPAQLTPAREKAIQHAIEVMGTGLCWGSTLRRFKREEMHKR